MDQSLVFTVISLSDFFGKHFLDGSWYPYWYLGGPFHYLIGPVVPTLLVFIQSFLNVSFYQSYIVLILVSLIIASVGTYFFLRSWAITKYQAIITSILALLLPWNILLLTSQNGLKHVSFSFLPFILLIFLQYIRSQKAKYALLFVLLLSLLLLTNASSFLAVLLGLVAIMTAEIRGNKKYQSRVIEILIGKVLLLVVCSLAIATLWYTPSYWWIMLANPSIGGIPLFRLIWNIFNALLSFLPIILALLVVHWRHGKIKGFSLFCLLFFISFALLTAFRFLADPDFMIDWLGFGLELQMSLSLILGAIVYRLVVKRKVFNFIALALFSGLLLYWLFLLKGVILYSNNSYKIDINQLVSSQRMTSERVFLSGSPVFWINNNEAISQVRGGNDMASIHPFWAHGAYQIREGDDLSLSDSWLTILGASYIVVHDKASEEPFHDFKHPEKFEEYKQLAAKKGNALYAISNSSIARIADKSLLQVSSPKGGADEQALSQYVSLLKEEITITRPNPSTILLRADIQTNEVISLAETYESGWRITGGDGKVMQDSFGNMIIIPEKSGSQTFVLTFQKKLFGPIIAFFVCLFALLIFWKFDLVAPVIKKRVPKLSIGLHDDDNDY